LFGLDRWRRKTMRIDTGSEFGGRADRRLRDDLVYWLVTVGPDGTPQPSPVWALRDGETFLVYSQASTPKLRNIAAHPRVALHLDGDGRGGDIVIVTGEARIDPRTPPADQVPAYVAKYREGMRRIGMTPESFARAYSVAVRVPQPPPRPLTRSDNAD
jgi:PPOX class probable F420-dependent enzyme